MSGLVMCAMYRELESEPEDTDIEDMYKEYPAPQTAGGPPPSYNNNHHQSNGQLLDADDGQDNDNANQQQHVSDVKIIRPRSISKICNDEKEDMPSKDQLNDRDREQSKSNHSSYLGGNDEVRQYLKDEFGHSPKIPIERRNEGGSASLHKQHSDDAVLSPDLHHTAVTAMTPRGVGTDAFRRMRSRSIQNRLARQKKKGSDKVEMKDASQMEAVSESKEMELALTRRSNVQQGIKSIPDVCPFWKPFEERPHCPYQAIHGECKLKHLSKSQYLDIVNEDDMIDLLEPLLTTSMVVDACSVTERLLEINPENDEYNTCMGDILEELGRYDEAERYYQTALRINPMYDDAHNNYAMMLHHKLNRVKEAEIEYRKCLSINANHPVCHTNYAKLLQHTSRYKEAEKHFKKCLKLNEDNVNCQYYFGVFLYELGRWSEAKYHLKKAIDLTGADNPGYLYNYAKLLCDLKEFSDADQHFQRCLKLEPENAVFNYEYALFLAFDLKDTKKSIQFFVKAYTLDPHDSRISKKYDEIAQIVAETGLTKVRRRKSSARIGATRRNKNGSKQKHTVVEYKDDDVLDAQNTNPCQAEFARFLQHHFSFGSCMNIYLKKFKDLELNDIRYLVAIDQDTLLKEVGMNKIHIKIMMKQIEQFKLENVKFISWLSSIALQEYYQVFEKNGILTFESFYHHIQSNADLICLLGDRNAFDVDLLWKSCPRFQRQSNSVSERIDNAEPHNDGDGVTGANVGHLRSPSAQIEGRR